MATHTFLLGLMLLLAARSHSGAAAAADAPRGLVAVPIEGEGLDINPEGWWSGESSQRRQLQQLLPCPQGMVILGVTGTNDPFCAEAAQSLPTTTWSFGFWNATLFQGDWIEVRPSVILADGTSVVLTEDDVSCFILPLLNTFVFDSASGNGSISVRVQNCFFKTQPPRNMVTMVLRMVVRCQYDPNCACNPRPDVNGTWPLNAVNPPINVDLRASATSVPAVCIDGPTTGTFLFSGTAIGQGTNFTATIDGQPCSPGPSPAYLANPNPANALISVTCNPPPGPPPASGVHTVQLTAFYSGTSPCATRQLSASFTAPIQTGSLSVDRNTVPAICATGVDTLEAGFRYNSQNTGLTTFVATIDGGSCTPGANPSSISGSATDDLIKVTCTRPAGALWPAGAHNITLTAKFGNCSTSKTATITVQPPPAVTVVPLALRVNGRIVQRTAGCGDSNTVFSASFRVTATNTASVSFVTTIDGYLCTPPPSPITSAPAGTIITVNCSRADGSIPSPGLHLLALTANYEGLLICSGGSTSASVPVQTPEAPQVSVTPLAVAIRPVCAGTTALIGRFVFSATSIPNSGVTTFVAQVDGQPCATSPAPITGQKPPPGTIVLVNCSKPDGSAFSPGPHALTLTANYPAIPPCPSGNVTSKAITYTVTDPPTVSLAPSQPVAPTCFGGDVTVSFDYAVSGATTGITYKATATSNPPGVCRATAVKGTSGTVTVICFGVTAPINSTIAVTLELSAASGGAGCIAGKANATAVSRVICCQSGFGYAQALTTADNETFGEVIQPTCWRHVEPVDDTNCLKPTGFAWGYYNQGPSAGIITAGIGTGCSGGVTVGYYSAVCTSSDTLRVVVVHNRFTKLRKPIGQLLWAGCQPPTGSNATTFEGLGGVVVSGNSTGSDRANDWPISFPRVPGGGIPNATFPGYFPVPNLPCNRWRPTGYTSSVAGTATTYTFSRPVPYTAKAVGCSCMTAYWSLFEQGTYTDDAGRAVQTVC